MAKSLPGNPGDTVLSLGLEDPLEEEMAEEPGGLQSMEWQRIRHNLATDHTHMHSCLFETLSHIR